MIKIAAALGLTVLTLTAGCGTSPTQPSPAASSGDPIRVVASTNVYGSIAEAIGGDAVAVTSIMSDPNQDPHDYEASARDQLGLSKAQIVIENGGGYDDFVDTMLKASSAQPTLINVATLSGYDQQPADGAFNEHLWYDFPTVMKLTDQLVTDLTAAAPDQAATLRSHGAMFQDRLQALMSDEAAIKQAHAGEGVAITEPVPLYLLDAAGLTNKTPAEFSEAIEGGTDVSPTVLKATVAIFDTRQVKLLAYNEQTAGPQTETVLAAAKANQIPVVGVRETLPADQDYLTWMGANVRAVADALGS